MYVNQIPTGGKAVQFYSSTIIKLFSSESDNQAIKGKIYVGDKIIEEKIGRKVRWDVQFSKTSPAFQSGEYDFYFRGDDVGVDSVADLVDTAEMIGLIERAGAWYTVEGERFQGREKLVAGVKEQLDIKELLIKKVTSDEV
jgi:recombination protein RecA